MLIRFALLMLAALAAWPFAGARFSLWLDQVFTVPDATLPLGRLAIDSSQFIIGSRRWWLTSGVLIAADSQRRVTLSSAGRTFTSGPINTCSANAAGVSACFDFTADPGDEISFVKTRSALAWPTPFKFSLIGAPVTSWRRHACDRLRWKKASGAQLDMIWRDEQGSHAEVGWTDGHANANGQCDVTFAIHSADDAAQAGSHRPFSARRRALEILRLTDPGLKAAQARALLADFDGLKIDATESIIEPAELPGRPALPRLVPAKDVPARSPFTLEGRAALLHAVTHIEFNAINLALDAVWRFNGMPLAYYRDWLRVASEEALHFTLLREHLITLGFDYGAFDAHDGLWAMTQRTAHDCTARMALVPRTLEARGLDAAPPMQAKLRRAGDLRAVEILDVILRDEVGHVAIGNHWYRWLCARDGHDPVALYAELAERYGAPRLRPPFNLAARLAAGFTEAEIALLS